MKDIETREDIINIMRLFYEKLLADHRISFFFNQVTHVNLHLDEHFELLATFWEQSLFLKGGYSNNMFQIHQDLHQQHPFTSEHFDIWLHYFNESIDKGFEGEKASQMKTQALSMATVMKIKFSQ